MMKLISIISSLFYQEALEIQISSSEEKVQVNRDNS